MDQLSNIIGMQGSKAMAAQAPRAKTSSVSDTQAFMKALNAKLAQMKGTQKLQAKLAEVDRRPAAEKTAIMNQLQASNPKNDNELLRNLTALLGNAQDVKPALTSDLAYSLTLALQADANDDAMLAQLTEQFQNGTQDIAQFRDQAIAFMQDAGMDPASIERMLVKLSSALGGQITVEQQTALMMPLDGDTAPKTAQAVQPDNSKYMAAHKAEDGYTPAAKDMPASQPAPQTQDAQAAAPKSQAGQSSAAHLSLINSFAAEGGDTSGGFTGQGFSHSAYNTPGMTAGTAATQTASGTPGSFVNYMGSASSAQTTQSIALQIHRNAQTQVDTFRMQLHPADLG
ncbi:MAG TPA: hypothetical protein VEF76_02550, partial [Patescibacteria group bacterium]|nr:hypothetical protein [Patescibacteria group bacterium]